MSDNLYTLIQLETYRFLNGNYVKKVYDKMTGSLAELIVYNGDYEYIWLAGFPITQKDTSDYQSEDKTVMYEESLFRMNEILNEIGFPEN